MSANVPRILWNHVDNGAGGEVGDGDDNIDGAGGAGGEVGDGDENEDGAGEDVDDKS